MPRFEFDLEHIRKNWELADRPLPSEVVARPVVPIRAASQDARHLLLRLRQRVDAEIRPPRAALTHFFAEAERLTQALDPAPTGGSPSTDGSSRQERLVRLTAVLMELEDLLAVYAGVEH